MRRNLFGSLHRRSVSPTFFKLPQRIFRGLSVVEMAVAVAATSLLLSIGVPIFLNQRTGAQDSVARSNVAVAARGALGYYTQTSTVHLPSTLDDLMSELAVNEPALRFVAGESLLPDQVSVARHSETLLVMAARSHSGLCVVAFANLTGPSFISNHEETPCDAESFDYVYGYIPIQGAGPADSTPPLASPPPTTTPTTLPSEPSPSTTEPPPTTTTTVPESPTTTDPPPTTTTTLPPPPTTTTTLPPPSTTTTTPAPSAPSGAFYEGYNMMAVGTGMCGVSIDLNNFSLEGGLHTNGWVSINANNGEVSGPATAAGYVNLNNTSFNGSFSSVSPISAPLLWHPSEWAPGSARAQELDKDWHYWPEGMTITKKNQKLEKGVHYVVGDVNISLGQNLKVQGTTIVATGRIKIDVNGPVELGPFPGQPFTLFAYSYGESSCDTPGIDVNANSAKLEGVFYSPHDKARLIANATPNFTGNLVASAIEVGGNVLWMYSP